MRRVLRRYAHEPDNDDDSDGVNARQPDGHIHGGRDLDRYCG